MTAALTCGLFTATALFFASLVGISLLTVPRCCNDDQWFFLLNFLMFAFISLISFDDWSFHMFKLLAVAQHEFGHAFAAWLTCNQVVGIEVERNEMGATHWASSSFAGMECSRWFVQPAGYMGTTVVSVLVVISTVSPTSLAVMSFLYTSGLFIILMFSLFGKDAFGNRRTLTSLCVIFMTLTLASGIICLAYPQAFLIPRTTFLFIGVSTLVYSVVDVLSDTVIHYHPSSDASHFALLRPGYTPKCVGIVWFFVCLNIAFLGPFSYVWITSSEDEPLRRYSDLPAWIYFPGVGMLAYMLLAKLIAFPIKLCTRT